MGVGSGAGGVELLARGQPDDAIDVEVVPVLPDHDLCVDAAAFEVPLDAGIQFVGDARTERVPDGDVLAGNLNLHARSTRRGRKGVKQPPRSGRTRFLELQRERAGGLASMRILAMRRAMSACSVAFLLRRLAW